MSLHTRSLKYGKLRNGQLVSIPPRLVRRLKSHFVHIPKPCGPSGVDVIIGMNGFVWVSLGTSEAVREGGEGFDSEGVYRNDNDVSGVAPRPEAEMAQVAIEEALYGGCWPRSAGKRDGPWPARRQRMGISPCLLNIPRTRIPHPPPP